MDWIGKEREGKGKEREGKRRELSFSEVKRKESLVSAVRKLSEGEKYE